MQDLSGPVGKRVRRRAEEHWNKNAKMQSDDTFLSATSVHVLIHGSAVIGHNSTAGSSQLRGSTIRVL